MAGPPLRLQLGRQSEPGVGDGAAARLYGPPSARRRRRTGALCAVPPTRAWPAVSPSPSRERIRADGASTCAHLGRVDGSDLRLTLHASLKPASGLDRFQPAGFPEIGHVIYDAPRRAVQAGLHETVAPDNRVQKVCIVDSAASMANHLESVCLASEHSLELASELAGMPYVECRTDDGWPNVPADGKGPKQLVVTTLSEAHRLASTYFLDGRVVENGKPGDRKFGDVLREEFKIAPLDKKSHPLPEQWWTVYKTIFRYDPNSLVHGVLFPAMGIKLPRMLTAHLEALGASRIRSSGVKFDKLGKTSSGQAIFSVDEGDGQRDHRHVRRRPGVAPVVRSGRSRLER